MEDAIRLRLPRFHSHTKRVVPRSCIRTLQRFSDSSKYLL
jgi:hypothetical protein